MTRDEKLKLAEFRGQMSIEMVTTFGFNIEFWHDKTWKFGPLIDKINLLTYVLIFYPPKSNSKSILILK